MNSHFRNIQDTTTVYTVSVVVYYTSDFKAVTSNYESYIAQQITETNTGYQNVAAPVRVRLHCAIEVSGSGLESADSATRLASLKRLRGTEQCLLRDAENTWVGIVELI